ncbi:hypothetical protein FRB99_001713 [Tulasnella sp. 403]|nr:hypothetical protein FRB99_001713 [Tulasnella sp. 403]
MGSSPTIEHAIDRLRDDLLAEGGITPDQFSRSDNALSQWDELFLDAYVRIGRCVQRRVSDIQARRNAFVAIHRLPVEILTIIFMQSVRMFLKKDDGKYYYRGLRRLRLVSRHWCQFIDETPSFWTFISATHSPPVWSMALIKSRDLPLIVDATPPMKYLTFSPITSFLNAVSLHQTRWKSFKIRLEWGAPDVELIQGMLKAPAPMLEDLHLDHLHTHREFFAVPLFAGTATRLKTLSLHQVIFPFFSSTLSTLVGLQHFSLDTQEGSMTPTIAQILELLAVSASSLKSVVLSRITFHHIDLAETERRLKNPIYLPFLRRLVIQDMPPTESSLLLGGIRAPFCTDSTLTVLRGHEEGYQQWCESIAQHIVWTTEITRKATPLRVEYGEDDLAFNNRTFILGRPSHNVGICRHVIKALPLSLRCSVKAILVDSIEILAQGMVFPFLDEMFPMVSELACTHSDGSAPTLEFLDGEVLDSTLGQKWLFPNLLTLQVPEDWTERQGLEVIHELVLARQDASEDEDNGRPKRLEEIYITLPTGKSEPASMTVDEIQLLSTIRAIVPVSFVPWTSS